MAGFGAKVRLSVDKSNKKDFNSQIMSMVNDLKVSKKFTVVESDIKRVKKETQSYLNKDPIILKVKKIDCSSAIKDVRKQLEGMLSALSVSNGINIGGLKEFIGTDGITATMKQTADAANEAADKLNQARQNTNSFVAQMKELDIIANSVKKTYASAISGKNALADKNAVKSITDGYSKYIGKLEEVRSKKNQLSQEEFLELRQGLFGVQDSIFKTQNEQLGAVAGNAKKAETALDQLYKTINRLQNSKLDIDDKELERYRATYLSGVNGYLEVVGSKNPYSEQNQKKLNGLIADANRAQREAISYENKLAAAKRKTAEEQRKISKEQEKATTKEMIALRDRLQKYLDLNPKLTGTDIGKKISDMAGRLSNSIDGISGADDIYKNNIVEFNKRFSNLRDQALSSGKTGRSLLHSATNAVERFGGWTIITRTLTSAIHAMRQVVVQVRELDAAMTELKKVTDESNSTYEKFFSDSVQRAKTLGATISDTISASADFARLGYQLEDAAMLADAALVYKNVGDGIQDITTASESVISTMQAFKISASDAMFIVDKFNKVGNEFAISSGGVGDALLRSASAMAAANNTLDETIALVTAANTVVQDPEKVGTTLKTVSMYLRAAKTEAEEAGESTDGMADSVSKLREEILSLTGNAVDIQIDENTFKSTYQIIKDLSSVWGNLTDITQANILEKIGGKRNANVVAAMINGFDVAEGALEASASAAGSALEENEKYLDSINGKLQEFNATFEQLSATLIDSEFAKDFVGIGTEALEIITAFIDELGTVPSTATTIAGTLSLVKSIRGQNNGAFTIIDDNKIGILNSSISDYMQAVKEVNKGQSKLQAIGNTTKTTFGLFLGDTTKKLQEYNTILSTAPEKQAKFMESLELTNAGMAKYINSLDGGKASIAGYITYCRTTGTSMDSMGVKAKAAAVSVGMLNAAMSVVKTLGISLAIQAVVVGVDKLIHMSDEAIAKADELVASYDDFKTTNKENISALQSLESEFKTLSSGVTDYGKNITLSAQEYERYKSIVEQVVGISPSLIEGYDAENGYLVNKNDLLERAIELQKEEYKLELQKAGSYSNTMEIFEGLFAKYADIEGDSFTKAKTGLRSGVSALFSRASENGTTPEDFARQIAESIGIQDIDKEIARYISLEGDFQIGQFVDDYMEQIALVMSGIVANLDYEKLGFESEEAMNESVQQLKDYTTLYTGASKELASINQSVASQMKTVAASSEGYDELSETAKLLVNDFAESFTVEDLSKLDGLFGRVPVEDQVLRAYGKIDEIIQKISPEMQAKLTEAFNAKDDYASNLIDISEFQKKIDAVSNILHDAGFDEDSIHFVEIALGVEELEEQASKVDDIIGKQEERVTKAADNMKKKFGGGNADLKATISVTGEDGSTSMAESTWDQFEIGETEQKIALHYIPVVDGEPLNNEELNAYLTWLMKDAQSAADILSKDSPENGGKGIIVRLKTKFIAEDEDKWESRLRNARTKYYNDQKDLSFVSDAVSSMSYSGMKSLYEYINGMDDADASFDKFRDKVLAMQNLLETNVEVPGVADYLTELDELSDGFEKIGVIYEDVKNKGDFDFGNLVSDEDFVNTFSAYTTEYNKFVETVANSPSDIQACQGAFDDLVSAWFYAKDPLKDINESTYELSVKWLKQAGVANANEIATYALAKSKVDAFIAGRDLSQITDEEIQKFLQENATLGVTQEMFWKLQLEMINASSTKLDFSQQLAALNELAERAGIAAISLSNIGGVSTGNAVANNIVNSVMNPFGTKLQKTAIDKQTKNIQEQIDSYKPSINYSPKSSGSSGSGGSSSSNEKYIAEIDKYKELSDAVEDVELKITHLDQVLDHTDSLEGQIALNDKLIGLYKDEQDALTALNNARDKEISDNVAKLRGKGFQIDYDPKSDNLKIKNMEHLNDLSQKEIKDYEDLIKATEDLNDANKESAETWTELTYKIADVGKEITKLRIDQYDQYISDAEHLIELFSNRKDALGKDLPIYDKMMQQTVATWKQLVEDGYDKNKDKIQELESAWMKFYDARLEREKELLEKQLDDHDSALDAVLDLIDAQNDKINDQIDSLKKVNEERKEALDLQKAQAALDKARNQKVRKVLRYGKGFVYEADQDAIKEAEETLADKKYESHISVLEQQKEALEELKNKWAEIPDLFDKYQNELLASEILGADWEQKILDDREDAYEDFRDAYFDLQDDIKDKSDELENHLNESYLEMVKLFEKFGQLNASPTLSANTSAGKTWYVEKDGSAPKDAQIGDIIKTKGGTYQIVAPNTPGAGYNAKTGRWNLKLDNNSADIKEGMWGTVAGTNGITKTDPNLAVDPSQTGNKQLTSAIGKNTLSNQGIVDAANDQIDTIYEEITGLEAVSRYLNSNSAFTQEETNILMKHMGLVDANSESEDANTDAADMNTAGLNDNTSSQDQNTAATDDLTRAITNLSFAQAQADQYVAQNNMKEGVSNEKWLDYWDHVLELTEDPLWKGKFTQADINNALAQRNQYAQLVKQEQAVKDLMNGKEPTKVELSDKDKDIIKSLQASWNAAKEAGNEQGMELAHQLAEAVRNGFDISPTLATKSDYKLSDTAFTGGGSVGSGNKSKVQSDREWQLEKAKEFGASKDYINRLEKAIAIEKYGSGSKVETYTDEQGRTSTVISSANKTEENMSAAELQKRWDNGWRPTMNSMDKLDNGLKNTNEGLSDNSDANYYAGDSALEAAETVKESARGMADSMSAAYNSMVSMAGSSVSSNGSSGYDTNSDKSNSNNKKKITGGGTDVTGWKSETVRTTTSKSGNTTWTTTKYTDPKTGKTVTTTTATENKKKKAKGGINLKSDIYNVDEEGSEMIIDNPEKGRWIRIGTGSSVIPANVAKNLWQFGVNPNQNIQAGVLNTLRSVQISSPRTNAASPTMIHVDRVEMHGVNDVLGFMHELQNEVMNLSSDADQFMGVPSNRRMS